MHTLVSQFSTNQVKQISEIMVHLNIKSNSYYYYAAEIIYYTTEFPTVSERCYALPQNGQRPYCPSLRKQQPFCPLAKERKKRMAFYDICLHIKCVKHLNLKVPFDIKNVPFSYFQHPALFFNQGETLSNILANKPYAVL